MEEGPYKTVQHQPQKRMADHISCTKWIISKSACTLTACKSSRMVPARLSLHDAGTDPVLLGELAMLRMVAEALHIARHVVRLLPCAESLC